ncbi:hypothetical protein C6H48_02355 [Vibrio cholerae]
MSENSKPSSAIISKVCQFYVEFRDDFLVESILVWLRSFTPIIVFAYANEDSLTYRLPATPSCLGIKLSRCFCGMEVRNLYHLSAITPTPRKSCRR